MQFYTVSLTARALLFAHLSSKSSVFSCRALAFSLTRRARSSLSCEILDLKIVFMIFILEKERSALATVIGSVANNIDSSQVRHRQREHGDIELIMSFIRSETVYIDS